MAMLFCFNKIRPTLGYVYTLTTHKLHTQQKLRFLGINITENLKQGNHIQSQCLKLSKVHYQIIKRCFKSIGIKKYLFCKVTVTFEVWNNFLGWRE
jgi:hypothetical protein